MKASRTVTVIVERTLAATHDVWQAVIGDVAATSD
jgi:hypothetical protein